MIPKRIDAMTGPDRGAWGPILVEVAGTIAALGYQDQEILLANLPREVATLNAEASVSAEGWFAPPKRSRTIRAGSIGRDTRPACEID